jgi:hypothetical protein
MQLLNWLVEWALGDSRRLAACARMPVPEPLREPLARLLRDVVEADLPEPECWRRWNTLLAGSGETLAPLEAALRRLLVLRRDPYASYWGGAAFPRPDLRYRELRSFLREQIARLGPPREPTAVGLPIPAAGEAPPPETLPRVTDDAGM